MGDKIQVLLVDDKRDFLDTISFWLNSKGYSVMLADNGRQAVELIKSGHFDIVFLDVNMPLMGGIETLACIRKFNKEIPVVILTAYGDKESVVKANQLGASGFFPKNANLTQFANLLEAVLRTHRKLHPSPNPSLQKEEKNEQDNRKEEK